MGLNLTTCRQNNFFTKASHRALFSSCITFLKLWAAFQPQISVADTSITVRQGSARTLDLGRKATKVVNLNPDLVRVAELDGKSRIQVHGLKVGEAKVETTFSSTNGKMRTRSFRITVIQHKAPRASVSANSFASSQSSEQKFEKATKFKELIKKNFKDLSASQIGESLYISGSISALREFRKLESLVTQFKLPCLPFYEMSDGLAMQIANEFNQRWNRGKHQKILLNYSNKSFSLSSDGKDPELLKPIHELLASVLPGFDAKFAEAESFEQTLVRVTFHFVEASQLRSSEKGQKLSGIHFPITGSLSRNGIEQAPFQYYVKYLNERMQTKILEQPELLTHSGREAVLHSGGDIAFDTFLEKDRRETRFRPYGLSATVTPRTLLSGSIQMNLQLEVSEPQSPANAQSSPSLTQRKIQTIVTVEDGMAQLIARLTRKKNAGSKSSAPFIEDIPILSWLVSSNTSHSEGSELWIFVSAASDLYSDFTGQDSRLDDLLKEEQNVLPD